MSDTDFELSVKKIDNKTVMYVRGRLDANTMQQFNSVATESIICSDKCFVVDMSEVVYLSSAGLRSILLAAKQAESDGKKFALCGASGGVKNILDVSGFADAIGCFNTIEDI